ncbi:hypothetical protein BDK51DRAFT_27267, partial [Blyttiomyces helicus]
MAHYQPPPPHSAFKGSTAASPPQHSHYYQHIPQIAPPHHNQQQLIHQQENDPQRGVPTAAEHHGANHYALPPQAAAHQNPTHHHPHHHPHHLPHPELVRIGHQQHAPQHYQMQNPEVGYPGRGGYAVAQPHNAIERARRESLNERFVQLAQSVPPLSSYRKPSKAVIVSKTIEYVQDVHRRIEVKDRSLMTMRSRNADLHDEVNRLRALLELPPAEMEEEIGVESEVGAQGMSPKSEGGEMDEGDEDDEEMGVHGMGRDAGVGSDHGDERGERGFEARERFQGEAGGR